MKERTKKILLVMLMFILLIAIGKSYILATDLGLGNLRNYGTRSNWSDQLLVDKINKVITVIQTVGSITSVVITIITGMRYMLGSIEEKAEYKKTTIQYLIGCAFIFATVNIISLIFNIAKDL